MVVHGAGRGAKLGFPHRQCRRHRHAAPGPGVYAGRGSASASRRWPAAINIGPNPTFGEQAMKVEVHLIGWDGCRSMASRWRLTFWHPLAGDMHLFSGVDELKQQLHDDVLACGAGLSKTMSWPISWLARLRRMAPRESYGLTASPQHRET